jgi:thiamine-phosphate diphosphorylase
VVITKAAPNPRVPHLLCITDGRGDVAFLRALVAAVLRGGVDAVQIREPGMSAAAVRELGGELRPLCEQHGARLLLNAAAGLAAAAPYHGVQCGRRSLSPAEARRALGGDAVIGFSAHDAAELELAAVAGCDFALLAPVLPTTSKPGAPHLGVARAGELTAAARLPVLWLGGIDLQTAARLAEVPVAQRPAGFAVRSALCNAPDPEAAARALRAALAAAQPKRPET